MGKSAPWKQGISKVFDIIGEILAVLLVLVLAVLLLNAEFDFLSGSEGLETFCRVLWYIFFYGVFLLVAVVGIEAMIKRNLILFILFAAIIALCVIFMFFPDVRDYLTGLIPA